MKYQINYIISFIVKISIFFFVFAQTTTKVELTKKPKKKTILLDKKQMNGCVVLFLLENINI